MTRNFYQSAFSLLNADYVQLNKSWNYRGVVSPFFRLYLISAGTGWLKNEAESVTLEAGFLYLVPSYTLCHYSCDDFLSQYYIQFIEESADGSSVFPRARSIMKVKADEVDEAIFKRLLKINPGRGLWKQDPRDYEKRPILKQFRDLNEQLTLSSLMETTGILTQLASRFAGNGTSVDTVSGQEIPSAVANALHYIDSSLANPHTVASLAARADLHADYFSRIFKAHTGERPLVYIQARRIEKAQFLMTTTNLDLSEIAEQTGFESMSYFSRIFRRVTGQTPAAYRIRSRPI